MNYPVTFRFKLIALASKITATDAAGRTLCHVRQKLFRLREKVEVFTDSTLRQLVATIEADRILDWSARYTFKTQDGQVVGMVGRRGMRSLWKAHYEVFAPGAQTPAFLIQEDDAWIKFIDGLVSGVPILGMFSGYLLHPSYTAKRLANGLPVMRLTKQPAFFEGMFKLEQIGDADDGEQEALLLSFLMMNLLERSRG